MICGALQTLNEEACEDVLEETELGTPEIEVSDIPFTYVVPPSPENAAGEFKNQNRISKMHASMSDTQSNSKPLKRGLKKMFALDYQSSKDIWDSESYDVKVKLNLNNDEKPDV